MGKPDAIIGKSIYELNTDSESLGKELAMNFGVIAKERLSGIIDKVLTEVASSGKIIRIEKLALDLGEVEYENIHELESRLEKELRKSLENILDGSKNSKDVQIIDASQHYIDLILYFLKTGALPWWTKNKDNFQPSDFLTEIKKLTPVAVSHFIMQLEQDPIAVSRLVRQFKDEELFIIIKKLSPEYNHKIILQFFLKKLLISLPGKRLPMNGIREIVWQTIFSNIKDDYTERLIPKVIKTAAISSLMTEKEMAVEALYIIFSDEKLRREYIPETDKFRKVYEKIVKPKDILSYHIMQDREIHSMDYFLKAVLPVHSETVAQLVKDLQSIAQFMPGRSIFSERQIIEKIIQSLIKKEDISIDEHLVVQVLREISTNTPSPQAIQFLKEKTVTGKTIVTSTPEEVQKKIESGGKEITGIDSLKSLGEIASHDELLRWIDLVNETISPSATLEKDKKAIQALLLVLNFGFIPSVATANLGVNASSDVEELIKYIIQRKESEVRSWAAKVSFAANPLLPIILKKNYSPEFVGLLNDIVPENYHYENKEWKKVFVKMILKEQFFPWYYQGKGLIEEEIKEEFKSFIQEERAWVRVQVEEILATDTVGLLFKNQDILPFLKLIDEFLYTGTLMNQIEEVISLKEKGKTKAKETEKEAKGSEESKIKDEEKPESLTDVKSGPKEKEGDLREKTQNESEEQIKSYSADKLAWMVQYMAVNKSLPLEESIHPDAVIIFLIRKSPLTASFLLASLKEVEMQNLLQLVSKDIKEKIKRIVNERINQEAKDFKDFADPLKLGEPVYIANAGLVLVHPFLQRFFTTLKLMEKRKFVSEDAQIRAAHILHYLVYKKDSPFEYDLLVNKLLCGLNTSTPIEKDLPLTDEEKELCESLLGGVIQNWSALKNTSPDNFRVSFLQREGKLYRQGTSWHIKIERRGYDVLVDRLPWGLGMIKLPWMESFVNVDWS